ncbi:hypothetical protein C8J57DRAFT_1287942, partial [Mycena rebaudengoi]
MNLSLSLSQAAYRHRRVSLLCGSGSRRETSRLHATSQVPWPAGQERAGCMGSARSIAGLELGTRRPASIIGKMALATIRGGEDHLLTVSIKPGYVCERASSRQLRIVVHVIVTAHVLRVSRWKPEGGVGSGGARSGSFRHESSLCAARAWFARAHTARTEDWD